MRKLVLILALTLILSFPLALSIIVYSNVPVSAAKNMVDTNPSLIILDVRLLDEYNSGHIRNAKHIPVSELEGRLNELQTTDEILVYCQSGGRSATASQILAENGFLRIYNMLEGVTAWSDAGYPLYVRYSSIQEAINLASPDDTIFVSSGTYYENVIVNKSISLLGEDRENTVIDGGEVGTVIQVDSDNVTINGFEIRNCSMTWGDWGITLNHSLKSVISGNIVKAVYAIRVNGGSENSVKDNDVVGYDGSCVFHGLQLVNSSSNVVNNNNLSVNCHYALTMYNSSNNIISFNHISGHFVPFPFTIEKSSNNSIVGNTMWQPAPLFGGHMHFTESNGNVLYHNSFLADEGPNTLSIDELSTNNIWDNGCEGNFWSDYNGIDSNGEGIGDTPYFIDENNQDDFPLMGPYWNSADINHDLEVNIYDVVTACAAYTSTPSSQNWNCHCDIAEPYGVIDIFDIVMICSNYGEEYTP